VPLSMSSWRTRPTTPEGWIAISSQAKSSSTPEIIGVQQRSGGSSSALSLNWGSPMSLPRRLMSVRERSSLAPIKESLDFGGDAFNRSAGVLRC
jgi:hypothetical protein